MDLGSVILTSILVVLGVAVVFYFLKQKESQNVESSVTDAINRAFPKALSQATDHLVKLADQKLKAEKQDIKTDLSNKKDIFEDLVKRLHQELESANKDLQKAEKDRIGSYSALKQELESNKELINQLVVTT